MLQLAAQLPNGPWLPVLQQLSQAREQAVLPPGTGAGTALRLIELAQALRERADRIV